MNLHHKVLQKFIKIKGGFSYRFILMVLPYVPRNPYTELPSKILTVVTFI